VQALRLTSTSKDGWLMLVHGTQSAIFRVCTRTAGDASSLTISEFGGGIA
jgi:hypothetical protein